MSSPVIFEFFDGIRDRKYRVDEKTDDDDFILCPYTKTIKLRDNLGRHVYARALFTFKESGWTFDGENMRIRIESGCYPSGTYEGLFTADPSVSFTLQNIEFDYFRAKLNPRLPNNGLINVNIDDSVSYSIRNCYRLEQVFIPDQ